MDLDEIAGLPLMDDGEYLNTDKQTIDRFKRSFKKEAPLICPFQILQAINRALEPFIAFFRRNENAKKIISH